jgi:leucyl aminopeptidase (aminopeptidase T)
VPFAELFDRYRIIIAPTEFSATAPLKIAARRHGFRAATMPGFIGAMIPALRLDWSAIDRRCRALKARLDGADAARFEFEVVGGGRHELTLDLRYRSAHASGGLLDEPGIAGNLPSGETYIVPYEGERAGEPSGSRGTLPLELDGEIVMYRIERNKVFGVVGDGPAAEAERRDLAAEPAYGNVAELGLGILRDYGISPIGEILLDEKLGLHLAFGRSDHFGGQVGPKDWRDPARVVHIDRVFIPEVMPRIRVARVDLVQEGGKVSPLMRVGQYV